MQPGKGHVLLLLSLAVLHQCAASCFFAPEIQGEFVMQSSVSAEWQVQYSRVNITGNSIPIWGICHKRIGNNVILMDDSGGGNCFRCFHLSLHSINVLQVRTEGLEKCYTTEDAADHKCPGNSRDSNSLQEILLYKTKQITGEEITQEFCPISGRYTFTYNVNEGTEDRSECPETFSELDNCPRGSELNLKFRRCSFENHDIRFQCLGQWSGPGRQKYLALLDTRSDGGRRAQYRCALYEEDARTGVIRMAFSSDSTCTSGLISATKGFETMVLTPVPKTRWPYPVDSSSCRFPRWAQGHWENLHVNGNQLTYRDQKSFHVSTVRCVGNSVAENNEKFGIYMRNQCGEDRYSCLHMNKRANNVVELKISQLSSDNFNETLCMDSAFDQTGSSWQTQGKIDIIQESPCPISGEFLGMIPDNDGLCAKLYSDCNNPEIMFFTVFDCSMPTDVFEARQPVRILPRWKRQQPRRIYHISNPRPLTSSTTPPPPPTTTTPTESPPSTEPPSPPSDEIQPAQEKLFDDPPLPPPRHPYDLPSQPPPLPPENYDNSGYPLPNYGYNYQPRSYGGYGFSRFDHLQPRNYPLQPQSSPSPIPEEGEVYDPWTFPRTHGNLSRPTWVTPPPRTTLPPPPPPPPPTYYRPPQRNNPSPTKREEREYRCLGQWKENGFTYTYTQRKDIGNSYECFVGLIVSKDEIFIKEAGSHCTRFKDITVHGMRLSKRGEAVQCHPRTTTPYPPRVPSLRPASPTTSWFSSKLPQPTPTKPWKPITAPPKDRVASGGPNLVSSFGFLLATSVLLLRMLQPAVC